jgi:hypothetical protein
MKKSRECLNRTVKNDVVSDYIESQSFFVVVFRYFLVALLLIIVFSLGVSAGYLNKQCDYTCVECPDTFFVVEDYYENIGFYYASIDDLRVVKVLSGNLLVWGD